MEAVATTTNIKKVRTPLTTQEQALQNELAAMRRINRVLDTLPRDARQRVISWAAQRQVESYGIEQSHTGVSLAGALGGNYR